MSRLAPAMRIAVVVLLAVLSVSPDRLGGQTPSVVSVGDSIMIRIVDAELRAAVQLLGQYLDRPVLYSGASGLRVTLETPRAISRAEVLPLLRGLVESQDHEFLADSAAGMYRVRPRAPVRPSPAVPPPLAATARQQAGVELHVIPLQHARAADVASTINALYGRGGGVGGSGARMPTLAEELRGNLVPPTGDAGLPVPGAAGARTASLSGDVTIVADPRANSLLVRADAQDLALVTGVVQALDVRPLQVLIEVIVAEVRRDRSLGLSAEAELQPTSVGRSGAQIQGTAGAVGLGDFALQVMGLGGLDLEATLRAAASRGEVRILTRPVVLATNNQLAEIVVGSQRPFVQVQRSLPTDAAARDQIVQYKDVGTRLSVRPTISRDGSVQLDVTQEVSTATAEVAFNAPVIATRSVQTQLLVTDGQTVALGGLTDRVREARRQGIPILSSIPLIGGLFGAASRQTIETELFIFLTPRVIRTDEDASRLSQPLQDRAKVTP